MPTMNRRQTITAGAASALAAAVPTAAAGASMPRLTDRSRDVLDQIDQLVAEARAEGYRAGQQAQTQAEPGPNDGRLQELLAEWRRLRAEDDQLEARAAGSDRPQDLEDQRDQVVSQMSDVRDRMAEIEPDTAADLAALQEVLEWELSISRDEADAMLTAGNARMAWRVMRFAFRQVVGAA
jgi:hypothetical protein